MNKQVIKIVCANDGSVKWIKIKATLVDGVPGLAVHGESIIGENGRRHQSRHMFLITHIASGRAIGFTFPTIDYAIAGAKRIKDIVVWTKSMDELVGMGNWYTDIVPEIKEALRNV